MPCTPGLQHTDIITVKSSSTAAVHQHYSFECSDSDVFVRTLCLAAPIVCWVLYFVLVL